ncbi:hypothetical protein ABDB81_18595 [Cupriavidus sp. DL-D2]
MVPRAVYRWDNADSVRYLRFIASNDLGIYAFYDLTKILTTKKDNRRGEQRFVHYEESQILPLLERGFHRVADSLRDSLPKEENLDNSRRKERAARWKMVENIFARDGAEASEFADDIYFSSRQFRNFMRAEARRQKLKNATKLYDLFWRCVKFGADEFALTDGRNRSGAPGQPRSAMAVSKKTGRKSADFYENPETYAPKDRFDPFWRRRTLAAIIVTVACAPDDAPAVLRSPAKFRELMSKQFCFAGANMRIRERRKLPGTTIPQPQTLEVQGMKMARRLASEIAPLIKMKRKPSPGLSTDIGLGGELLADMDVTDFKKIRIMFVTDDESEMRELGAPRVVLAVVRGSDYILGYYVSIGFEDTDIYQNGLLSGFTSKNARLAALGFDPPLEGMESGKVDLVVVDGGPGKSKRSRLMVLKTLKIDLAKVGSYFPQGKGNVEGANHHLKARTSSNLNLVGGLLETLAEGLEALSPTKRLDLQHGRGIPSNYRKQEEKEGIFFFEEHVFERVLVEAINEHNLAMLTTRKARTQKLFAKRLVPSRLEKFREQQSDREGDQAFRHPTEEIYAAILRSKKKNASVLRGLIALPEGEYGGRTHDDHPHVQRLRNWEDRHRLEYGLPDDGPIKITVSSPPHGNVVTWHTDSGEFLDIPATPQTVEFFGVRADRSRVVAMRLKCLSDRRRDRQLKMEGKKATSKGFTKEARAQSDAIKRRRGITPTTSTRPRSSEVQLSRLEEKQRDYDRAAEGAGVQRVSVPPKLPEADSTMLASMDDDVFGLRELQVEIRKRPANPSQ